VLAAAFIMCDVIRRFFSDLRPADWVMSTLEVIFILVILWLEIPERWHKHKVRKKLKIVQAIMESGHTLRTSVADANTNNETASKWMRSVQNWIDMSYQTLAGSSVQAGLAFVHRNVAPDINFYGVTSRPDVSKQFQELLIRLDNLLNIMEKADVYF
jgi:hypothetical protein